MNKAAEEVWERWQWMHQKFPQEVENILSDIKKRSDTQFSAQYLASFGVFGTVSVDEIGICNYSFRRTGYDGYYRVEGRCNVRDAVRMIEAFLDVKGAAEAYKRVKSCEAE